MSDALDLGVTGIEAALGDHICGLYSNQLQRDQILLPFLEAGLAAGDKCICVVDGTDPNEVVAALGTRRRRREVRGRASSSTSSARPTCICGPAAFPPMR